MSCCKNNPIQSGVITIPINPEILALKIAAGILPFAMETITTEEETVDGKAAKNKKANQIISWFSEEDIKGFVKRRKAAIKKQKKAGALGLTKTILEESYNHRFSLDYNEKLPILPGLYTQSNTAIKDKLIAEQLDMQYHDSLNGTTTWKDAIANVKTSIPKT